MPVCPTRPLRKPGRREVRLRAIIVLVAACCGSGAAQVAAPPSPASPAAKLTLKDAIARAEENEPTYRAGVAAAQVAALDRSIARNALLPGAVYHNQALYTQPNGEKNSAGQVGSQAAPRFIANNAVREYASQAVINETVGLAQVSALRVADAEALRAAAEAEIARRGLVATVVGLFYNSVASGQKLRVADRAVAEAHAFTDLTAKREAAREVAHADLIKAQLLEQQKLRDQADARLAAERDRLELAILLFPDPRADYELETGAAGAPLPTRADVEAAAAQKNPELRSALAALAASKAAVAEARAAYLPDVGLNFTYGIDAPQFAVNGLDRARNLGYSAAVTFDIPVWDWFSTHDRVKQQQIQQQVVKLELSTAQKRLVANLEQFYNEAVVAQQQVASLQLSVTTAAESLRLSKLRYSAGEASALEVVDAQNTLTTTEAAQADSSVRYWTALANLQTLTGSL